MVRAWGHPGRVVDRTGSVAGDAGAAQTGPVILPAGLGAAVAIVLLLGVLAFAVVRPRRLPEAVAAVPAAVAVLALGLVPWDDAVAEARSLGSTLAFLAAILVLAHLAQQEGVFTWAGDVMARRSRGTPQGLLGAVFVVASITTAALSLDATVVLLTPVVLTTAALIGVPARPGVYASTHLANSASTLLPVSNLTNLLAFAASGLSFAGFAALMAVPWLAVVAVEYAVVRWFFRADLRTPAQPGPDGGRPDGHGPAARDAEVPRFALSVLALSLVGFAVAEPLGVDPAWVAAAGALVLAARRLLADPAVEARVLLRATNLPFLAFVLSLGVVVLAVRGGPVGEALAAVVPTEPSLAGLLGAAALAALAANLLNNLPATLVLVPLVAHSPGLVLATLLGLNIGPNLTYVGSLATLLWRQVLHAHDHEPSTRTFLRLGLATVPVCLVVGVLGLWAGLQVGGVG